MFPTSPEDRLLQVRRFQVEQREQMASERMAKAAAIDRTSKAGAHNDRSSGWHALLEATAHVLQAITRPQAIARHRVR